MINRTITKRVAAVFLMLPFIFICSSSLGSFSSVESCQKLLETLRELDHFPKNLVIPFQGLAPHRGLQIMAIINRHKAPFLVRTRAPTGTKLNAHLFKDFDFTNRPPLICLEGTTQKFNYEEIVEIEPLKTVTDKYWRVKDLRVAIQQSAWRSENDGPHPWKDFETSDPRHHDPNNFTYIVHAIKPDEYGSYERALEYFLAKPTISTSLISTQYSSVYLGSSKIGFILSVPAENIVSATTVDALTDELNQNSTRQQYLEATQRSRRLWGVMTPEQVIYLSPAEDQVNEIYAKTNFKFELPDTKKTEIKGIFVKTNKIGVPIVSDAALAWARNVSVKLKIPLIFIP